MVTAATRKGPRPYQEDRYYEAYIPDREWQLIAVMDGHGGDEVSSFCEKNIHRMFSLEKRDPKGRLSQLVSNLNSATRRYESGSTFSAVIISRNIATVAVLGDSPVIILDSKGELYVSPEHNVRTNLKERQTAQKRGAYYDRGYVWVGDSGLQMSRALGDSPLDSILCRKPEIYEIKNSVWILVASDGIFDPSHDHEETKMLLKDIEKFAKKGADADAIMDWASERGLNDNATAVVWKK